METNPQSSLDIAMKTVLDWQFQGLSDSWDNRGGVYCKAVGPHSGKTYEINFIRFIDCHRVYVEGQPKSFFKTEEEAKAWALVLERMAVVSRA